MGGNHQKYYKFGEGLVVAQPDIPSALQSMEQAQLLLPIWTDWGIQDSGVSIHSLGVTFLTLLGQHLGFVPACEFPAPHQGEYAYVGDDVRSDVVWFDPASRTPILIGEFERYTGPDDQKKLQGKVANLLLAHHRWGIKASFLLLAYWTKSVVSPPDHNALKQEFQWGFQTLSRQRVAGTQQGQLLCVRFVLRENQQAWYLNKIILI